MVQSGAPAARGSGRGYGRGREGRSRLRGRRGGRGRGRGVAAGTAESSLVIQINKRIKAHGEARRIDDALRAFASLEEQGLRPTAVSYNVILFALVKCGELQRADEIYQQMSKRGDVHANVVTLTSLLKGHAGAGDMQSASALLEHMLENEQLRPNTRSLNTFLRGCLWTGDVDRASKVFARLCGPSRIVSPDSTTVDYVLRLFATSLQLADALHVFVAHEALVAHTPFPLVALGEASAVAGDVDSARQWLERASLALHPTASPPEILDDDDEVQQQRPGLANFVAHQRAELRENAHRVQLALDVIQKPNVVALGKDSRGMSPPMKKQRRHAIPHVEAHDTLAAIPRELPRLVEHWSKILLFPSTGRVGHHGEESESAQARESVVDEFVRRLHSLGLPKDSPTASVGAPSSVEVSTPHPGKFAAMGPRANCFMNGTTCCGCYCTGLRQSFAACKRRCCSFAYGHWTCCGDSSPDSTHCRPRCTSNSDSHFDCQEQVRDRLWRTIGPSRKIRLPQLFGLTPGEAIARPVNLEVCSGNGEWIAAMAAYYPEELWVALELRHNRCASIFQRGVLGKLGNLAVLGGDATILCQSHLKKHSVDRVLVTFPEPPSQHDHQGDGDHLLDSNFVANIQRILKPKGEYIVVTDNLPYAKVCARATYGGALPFVDIGRQALTGHGDGGIGVNTGVPVGFGVDIQCRNGAGGNGGSFFDRLWEGRGKSKRFFIQAQLM